MKFFIYKETLILNIRQKFVKMVYFLKFEVIYMLSTIISIITIIVLIIAIIVKPTIKIKKYEVQTFWIIPLIGTLILLFPWLPFLSAFPGPCAQLPFPSLPGPVAPPLPLLPAPQQ